MPGFMLFAPRPNCLFVRSSHSRSYARSFVRCCCCCRRRCCRIASFSSFFERFALFELVRLRTRCARDINSSALSARENIFPTIQRISLLYVMTCCSYRAGKNVGTRFYDSLSLYSLIRLVLRDFCFHMA